MTPEEQKLVDESFTHMNLESKNLVAERVEQLKTLFPEITVEGDGTIDFEKLRLILGDDVDEGQERYAFTWPGKADAIRQAQTPSTATLRPDEADSVDWDITENIYIEGDNLEVLKLLQRGYHGKVKMIYIDPPYNTGHDFVYKDSFQDSIENYKEQAGLSGQSNADTSGRYHSDWLNMMYPRLKLARELLSEDGVLFISIDDNELNNLVKLCGEIFGDNNLVATVTVTVKPEGRRYGAFAKTHEYILAIAKSIDTVQINEVDTPGASFSYTDTYGGFNLQGLRNRNVRAFNASNRPNLSYPFYVDPESKTENGLYSVSVEPNEGFIEVWPAVMDGLKSVWRWGAEKAHNEIEDLTATLGADGHWRIFQKVRTLTQTPKTTWTDKLYQSNRGTKHVASLIGSGIFDFPKPVELLAQLVRIGSNPNSLIMDFFSGSGSLAEAVMRVNSQDDGNRMCISIQLPERCNRDSRQAKAGFRTLCEIGESRIRKAGQVVVSEIEEKNKQLKLGENPKRIPDIGFRVLKLDSSNFEQVADGALIDDLIKPDRTHDDIIFEMMLKWGLELSLPMEKTEVAGYPVTSIAADELICCMDEGLTVEVLESIAALEPKRVFFLDSVLTDTIKLNAAQIFKRVGDKLGYEIELRTA